MRIPDTVKALDEHNIFYGCSPLAEIKMPDKAIPVVYSIFDGTAYADKTLNPSHYENGAFYVDKFLIKMDKDFNGNSLTLRAGTLVIADSAFYVSGGGGQNSINITSVTLPDGLKRIGRSAFNGCEKLSTINIPASVESVGESAFASTALGVWNNYGFYVGNWLIQVKDISTSKFTIVDGTIGIADGGVFSSSQTLTEIELPSSLKYIGAQAFKNTQITSVVLPVGLISIGQEAFYCCFALSQINLGDCSALHTIGEDAFTCCNFTEIRIPSSVEHIGATIFNGNQQELIVNCAVSEKPQGWSSDWAKNVVINGKKITVNWNS